MAGRRVTSEEYEHLCVEVLTLQQAQIILSC